MKFSDNNLGYNKGWPMEFGWNCWIIYAFLRAFFRPYCLKSVEKGWKGQFQAPKSYKELSNKWNQHCNIVFEILVHKKCIVSNVLPSNKAYQVMLGLFRPITPFQAVGIKNCQILMSPINNHIQAYKSCIKIQFIYI